MLPHCRQISGSYLLPYSEPLELERQEPLPSSPILPLKKGTEATEARKDNLLLLCPNKYLDIPTSLIHIIDYSLKLASRPVQVFTEQFNHLIYPLDLTFLMDAWMLGCLDAYEVKVNTDIFKYQEKVKVISQFQRFFFHFSMAY